MRRKTAFIPITLFLVLIILPTLVWGGLSLFPDTFEYLNQEIGENRLPHEMAENITIQNITTELEDYYSDRAPFRNVLITANENIDGFLEKDYATKIQPVFISMFYSNNEVVKKDIIDYDSDNEFEDDEDEYWIDYEESEVTDNIVASISVSFEEKNDNSASEEVNDTIDKTESDIERSFTEVSRVAPSCTEDGVITYAYDDNEETFTEVIPALGHSEEVTKEVEASYTKEGYKLYKCTVCGNERKGDITDKLVDESYYPEVIKNHMILGRDNWVFYEGENSLKYYKGTNIMSKKKMANILSRMVELQNLCNQKGKTLLFMVYPNREQVYPEFMPTYYDIPEKKRLDVFSEYIKKNSTITFLYPINELKAGKKYYNTYYKYDPHWNTVGSFIGEQVLAEKLGIAKTDISTLNATRVDGVITGCLNFAKLKKSNYPADYEYLLDYRPEVKIITESGRREMQENGYDAVIKITSTAADNRKFVLIGDSFSVNLAYYIYKDFSDSTIIHRDFIDWATQDVKDAEILVLSVVERYDEHLIDEIEACIVLLSE